MQMGALLDSAKKIRKRKKSPPRQAHCKEKKLEKDKTKGIKWQQKELTQYRSGKNG